MPLTTLLLLVLIRTPSAAVSEIILSGPTVVELELALRNTPSRALPSAPPLAFKPMMLLAIVLLAAPPPCMVMAIELLPAITLPAAAVRPPIMVLMVALVWVPLTRIPRWFASRVVPFAPTPI